MNAMRPAFRLAATGLGVAAGIATALAIGATTGSSLAVLACAGGVVGLRSTRRKPRPSDGPPGDVDRIAAGKVESRDRIWLRGRWRKVAAAVIADNGRKIRITTGGWWPTSVTRGVHEQVDVVRHKGAWG